MIKYNEHCSLILSVFNFKVVKYTAYPRIFVKVIHRGRKYTKILNTHQAEFHWVQSRCSSHSVSFHTPEGTMVMCSHSHTFVTWYEVTLSGLIETISHDRLTPELQISIPKPSIRMEMGVWYLSAQRNMSLEKNLTVPFSLFQFSYLTVETFPLFFQFSGTSLWNGASFTF